MREILFGAIRLDNGEWVEGHYVPDPTLGQHTIICDDGSIVYIRRDTLSQFTGFPDLDGERIWAGSVLRDSSDNIHIVWWDQSNGCWAVGEDLMLCEVAGYSRVIGNIHDNPELLDKPLSFKKVIEKT